MKEEGLTINLLCNSSENEEDGYIVLYCPEIGVGSAISCNKKLAKQIKKFKERMSFIQSCRYKRTIDIKESFLSLGEIK